MSVGNGIEEETYLHDGFIFLVQNRLYFLGVGQTIGGPYLRPMIMKNVDPKKEPIKGMLLTERKEGNIPLATKTIMVREDMPNKPSLDQIRADLENESEFDHILYGWGDA